MKKIIYLFLLMIFTACSRTSKNPLESPISKVIGERVEYSQGEDYFSGYLTYGPDKKDPRPGIILIHHWAGLDEFTMREADKFAQAGYIVFAMDMYGRDVIVDSHEEAARISGYYRNNRNLMRSRIERSIEILKANPYVDAGKLAVVGYCFGGDALIDYMLYKDDFTAGISFHGFYTSPLIEDQLLGSLQIHHGELDKASTMEQLETFTSKHPESEVYVYEGTDHAYTDPDNKNYNKEAADLSFERANFFLKQNLSK